MACLRLFTVPPFPPLPDLSVPFFFLCIALFTDLPAALPYFRLPELERFLAAIVPPFIHEKRGKENELRPKNGPFNPKMLSCANFREACSILSSEFLIFLKYGQTLSVLWSIDLCKGGSMARK